MRVRLRIAYRGTSYHGWQRQPQVRTVQGELLRAAARVLNQPEDTLTLQGASRTDAGVHALAQTAHLDHDTDRTPWDFVRGLNALTDDDVCVIRAEEVDEGFHARHDARGKIYRYRIWNHRFAHPLALDQTWHVRKELDLARMRDAAARLIGEHDFAAFRASDCQASTTTREISRVDVTRTGQEVTVVVEGNAFLKYMVRIITGTLVGVGEGRLAPGCIDEMLATGERARGGATAPPGGLTLMNIHYPEHPWRGGPPTLGGPWL